MVRTLLFFCLFCVVSTVQANRADAWHHFLGAYGVRFYNPAAYVYAAPAIYAPRYAVGFYGHPWRPFHHHFARPRVFHYPLYAYSSFYVSSPLYYSAPIYYQSPIVYQTAIPFCYDNGGQGPAYAEEELLPTDELDSQLQIRNQTQSQYLIAQNSDWIDVAVKLIDEMAASGGFVEAEAACHQLIAVRDHVPPAIHLRSGLLALKNGKSIDEAATALRAAVQIAGHQAAIDALSDRFVASLDLKDFSSIENHIQVASQALLNVSGQEPKTILASERAGEYTVMKPAGVTADENAALVLDLLLRANGQAAKADAIADALASLPNL